MNKQVRISIIMSICIVGMLFSSFLPFFYHKSLDNASDDDVDLNSLLSQAIHYDNLFQISHKLDIDGICYLTIYLYFKYKRFRF